MENFKSIGYHNIHHVTRLFVWYKENDFPKDDKLVDPSLSKIINHDLYRHYLKRIKHKDRHQEQFPIIEEIIQGNKHVKKSTYHKEIKADKENEENSELEKKYKRENFKYFDSKSVKNDKILPI